jgi:hypothetical protein
MRRTARAFIGCASALATAVAVGSCSTTTACITDSNGNHVCDTYAAAYPYDYAYIDPLYATTWGYYPYYVDTYYDPYGYSYVYYALPAAAPVPIMDPPPSNVPPLLDRANRAANAVDVGVRAALDPIKDLIKTKPSQSDDTIVYGPADRGSGTYQFTMRLLSDSDRRFGWKLEARPAGSTDGFTRVAGGLIRVGDQPRRGHGTFGVDCDALNAADASVGCRGTLLMGFAHTNDGDKVLSVALKGYTPDANLVMPLDAAVFAWRHGDTANRVRVVTRTNLPGTASAALETVAIKLTWLKDVGVRADAIAAGGDIAQGQAVLVSTCVPADLNQANAMTSTQTCSIGGTGCTGGTALSCATGLQTSDAPQADPMANDPPAGMPEMPAAPAAMPDGEGN